MMAFYLHYLKNMIELNYILLRYRWWIQLQLSSNLRFLINLSPGPNSRAPSPRITVRVPEEKFSSTVDSIVITAINKLDKMSPHCLSGFERLTHFLGCRFPKVLAYLANLQFSLGAKRSS